MTHRVPQAELSPEVLRTFPLLATASDEVLENLHQAGMQVEVPAQRLMYVPGEPCMGFPLVLSGRARVYTVGENGREITLYRLCAGETCVLAVACILSRRMLPAYIVAETSGAVLLVPPETFRGWFEQVPFWRTFVFSLLAERLANVIAITNDALFGRL
ncbi:MAG: Crp/Fnr family transcriptional regulator, partial [Acidobacteriota bacterium]